MRIFIPIFTLLIGTMLGYSWAFLRIRDAVNTERPLVGTHPFRLVIEKTTGHSVLPISKFNDGVIDAIAKAANATLQAMNAPDSPLRDLRRINEASRFFEDSLLAHLNANPLLTCAVPKTTDGVAQRSGYPDLEITHIPTGVIYYLDPKLYEATSQNSSLRTFYYTPRQETLKIQRDAHHLLIGFAHDGVDGDWTFQSWTLIDLAKTELTLKAEFNASNADLYREDAILRTSVTTGQNLGTSL